MGDRYLCHYALPLVGIYNHRMTLESLLLSADSNVESVLRPTLEKLAIEVEICREARSGSEILLSEKFDAVIVDCDDLRGGLALLEGLRATPSNKSSVSFAILNGKKTTTQQAFGMGANFVLQKPISALNASGPTYGLTPKTRSNAAPITTRMPIPESGLLDEPISPAM